MPTDHQQHLSTAHGHPGHPAVSPQHLEPHTQAAHGQPHAQTHAEAHHAAEPHVHTQPTVETAHHAPAVHHSITQHAAATHAVSGHSPEHPAHEAHHAAPAHARKAHEAHPAPAPQHGAHGHPAETPPAPHSSQILTRGTPTPASSPVHVASVSHFNDPIPHDGKPHGFSRQAGDAPVAVKEYVVNTLINECHKQGLSREDTAHVLSIARLESGFNPDAAATSTSACGVGQFIHATGEGYGLSSKNRFDVHDNAKAMVEHYVENKKLAQEHGKGEAYIYKYYHDGPSHNSGGLELAHKEVLPYIHSYTSALDNMSKGMHHMADSMKVFLADTGQYAHDFFHGGSHQGASPLAVARAESPFQKDHLERVAFHNGGAPQDRLGLDLIGDRSATLASALAETMRLHGYDSHSVGQSGELAKALLANAGARSAGQDVLIIHKNGDVLASLASKQDVNSLARPGDTVLDLRSLDRVALVGFDNSQLNMARNTLSGQASGMSNLELAQFASNVPSSFGNPTQAAQSDMGRERA
jgi:hypothetical protein